MAATVASTPEKPPLATGAPFVYPGTAQAMAPPTAPAVPPYWDAPPPYSQTTQTHVYQTTTSAPQQQHAAPPYVPPPGVPPTPLPPQPAAQMAAKPPPPPVLHQQPAALAYIPPAPVGSQRVVESTPLSRRTTLTVVSDLATGQQYTVKEKKSLSGRRSKTIIREAGGQTTVVKKTPRRTVVKQRF